MHPSAFVPMTVIPNFGTIGKGVIVREREIDIMTNAHTTPKTSLRSVN